ncbi:type VI immunity family protein [Paraburkholderia sp. BCC1886]|uniref:type VI immunity family protein n=1 Tax=Paraburkholderia sp. BCC1886 TaxID=2562670 RepID=UPI001183B0D8|nr:type VI immunity family protein [Paraburkholderia sp. BCC1886]
MSNELEQWAKDPSKAGTLPYAAFEPKHPHDGVGAALVVRAALYFKGGFTTDKREALAWALDAYIKLASVAGGEGKSPLRWLWFNGKPAIPVGNAPTLSSLAKSVGDNEGFDAIYVGGDTAREASFYEFKTFCLERFQAELGTRGLDVLEFSLPFPFVRSNPEPSVKLFHDSAAALDAVHGHAGLAVNLSPTGRTENESSEYFMAQQLGPGLDVGDPIAMKVRKLTDRIKTTDWLTLINGEMVNRVGQIATLQSELPKAWFSLEPCAQGLLIRAGVAPQAGVPRGDGQPVAPPPAYIVLNSALREILTNSVSSLQRGTVNGDAPVYNTTPSSDAWLRRFDVSPDDLLQAKAAILDTPKLPVGP